jgi:phosphatidate cytidylyltransferase
MNFVSRVLSAAVGILLLAALAQFAGAEGLALASGLLVIISLNEFRRLVFPKIGSPMRFQILFLLAAAGCFASVMNPSYALEVLGLSASICVFLTLGLWFMRGPYTNEQILRSYGVGLMGLIYCAAFPAFALKLLFLSHGVVWFFSLLVIIFSGDTFAYFGGRFFGKRKLFESISPKKTIEGASAGALGSALVGAGYFAYFLPQLPLPAVIGFCLICSIVGQSGDLFMSLIKRVAEVKDTGRLMPGHGGVLDRIDGLLMAAPLVYTFAVLCLYFFDL